MEITPCTEPRQRPPSSRRRVKFSSDAELYTAVAHEQEADDRLELRRLSDLSFVFLHATDGDADQAIELLEQSVGLLCEGGVLSTWRYRTVLAAIREGL